MKIEVADPNVASCSAHCKLKTFQRLDVIPFVVFYVAFGLTVVMQELEQEPDGPGAAAGEEAEGKPAEGLFRTREWRLLMLLAIFVGAVGVHVITLLSGFWSVKVRCMLRYRHAISLDEREDIFMCVIPSVHCGPPGLAKLKKIDKPEKDMHLRSDKISLEMSRYWFEFQRQKYWYDKEQNCFHPLDFPVNLELKDYMDWGGHGTELAAIMATSKWGRNEFDIPMPSLQELFIEHALAPFFLFQVFCVGLWCLDEYWYYSLFTLVMLVLFELTMCKQQQQNLGQLRGMRRPAFPIFVFRHNQWMRVLTTQLVPGDIISILPYGNFIRPVAGSAGHIDKDQLLMPCDALLLRGSCIVNEAMLTGESVPKMKDSVMSAIAGDSSLKKKKLDMGLMSEHVIMGGTKVMQHTMEPFDGKFCNKQIHDPPDGGCIGFVLRTGFSTSQGSLMRTILFSTEHVTVDNAEAYRFILVLLVFAVLASVYVLVEGLRNEKQSRWKLFLHCTMIITSVVPPELPMELSLAVNTSLSRLIRLAIYCTEPYRIPFAGRLDICCFDKTGTLTSDTYLVKGIAVDLKPKNICEHNTMRKTKIDEYETACYDLVDPLDVSREATLVIAGCHQLIRLEDSVEGDPMEQAAVRSIRWAMAKDGRMVQRSSPSPSNGPTIKKEDREQLVILHRHPFSSAMKRMSSIVQVGSPSSSSPDTYVLCKGAPEVLEPLLHEVPERYREAYQWFMIRGARVLALAYKRIDLKHINFEKIKTLPRKDVESGLHFAGFLVLDCPLKDDTAETISQLIESNHRISVITGDSALTACDVARQLGIIKQSYGRILTLTKSEEGTGQLMWRSIDSRLQDFQSPAFDANMVANLVGSGHELVITGAALDHLSMNGKGTNGSNSEEAFFALLQKVVPHVVVFARVSPQHKEMILTALKGAGLSCLMCGDGTNDVGALKQADVGVSIVNSPDYENAAREARERLEKKYRNYKNLSAADRVRAELASMEEAEAGITLVQLGDASIASPFTSRTTSIQSTVHIIRQGRCTLVTTIQMYKILALNCLVNAYALSSLYLYGVKQGDTQATIAGLMIAVLFMCIAWAEPVESLSQERPVAHVFSVSVMVSLAGHLLIHFATLLTVIKITEPFVVTTAEEMDPDADFKPNVINTAVFLANLCMQCNIFGPNYRGRPFMQPLMQNKGFSRVLLATWLLSIVLALDIIPDLNEYFELVPIPTENNYQQELFMILIFNTITSWGWEHSIRRVFKEK